MNKVNEHKHLMRVVADENIPDLDAYCGDWGELITVPGREIKRETVADAQVLFVRSVTDVNASLLERCPLRFVGSATIGTDHSVLQNEDIPLNWGFR